MSRRQTSLRLIGVAITAIFFVCAMACCSAHGATFSVVEPTSISAGMFYHGATLRISGSIGGDSQVVIRIKGASEHHVFNRRGKIGGIIWGGVEHVTFRNAPSFYAIYSSTSLEVAAAPDERSRLQLGYGPLEAQMDVEGTKADKHLMIGHFVHFKESEGLYRVVPGGVHLADPEGSKRAFDAAIPLSASTPPGDFEVAVFELVKGSLVHEDMAHVDSSRGWVFPPLSSGWRTKMAFCSGCSRFLSPLQPVSSWIFSDVSVEGGPTEGPCWTSQRTCWGCSWKAFSTCV